MDDKQKLFEYLKLFDLLILATGSEFPSAATVHYGIDNNFIFYIITSPSTEHGKNIEKNSNIAGVIVDTKQRMYETKTKKGVQLKGRATQILDPLEIQKALELWSKGKKDIVEKYQENITSGKWSSRPYKIVPTQIKWLNEELFGEEGTKSFSF